MMSTSNIIVPIDVWNEIVKCSNVPRLTIHTDYYYGKLFGKNVYVGAPISLCIKICINNPSVYVVQYVDMYITNDLNIEYSIDCLNINCIKTDNDGRLNITVGELADTLNKMEKNITNFWEFGIGHDGPGMFAFGSTIIEIGQDQITSFMKQYISVLREFQERCKQLMINHKKTINPENEQTGFYVPLNN